MLVIRFSQFPVGLIKIREPFFAVSPTIKAEIIFLCGISLFFSSVILQII